MSADNLRYNEEMTDVLKKVSPGTAIRNALDDLLMARMGALIVIEKEGLSKIVSGGFRIDSKFSAQKLLELAKMDGAIILSEDFKRIISVNTLITPDVSIPVKETGTRHQAAERTAKQFGSITIAVSERKNKISVYYKDEKQELELTSEVLRRATETLQILEKQKDIFDEQIVNFNILEINNLVSISDVCNILKRIEIIKRIADSVRKYLIELGKEGVIVSMRLKELTRNINADREMILIDYFGNDYVVADESLRNMNFDFLIETSNISRILFGEENDKRIITKGTRILGKTDLLEKDITSLIEYFGSLDKIFNANKEDFFEIFKNQNFVDSLSENIRSLREKIISGKIL